MRNIGNLFVCTCVLPDAKDASRLIPFGGWEMPVQYTSIVEEHLTVRRAAGIFDISHMGEFIVHGVSAEEFLDLHARARAELAQGRVALTPAVGVTAGMPRVRRGTLSRGPFTR